VNGAAEPGSSARGAAAPRGNAAAPTASIGAGYTIDIPRVAEAAFGEVVFSVASGNVVPREPTNELRLRIRGMNTSRYEVGFGDDLFRLAIGGEILSPTSGL